MQLEQPINVSTYSGKISAHIFQFHVLGCGGTGSFLIPDLARIVSLLNSDVNSLTKCSIYLYDGDEVEEKNITRQNFISSDIGRNKAEVLQERYSSAFGINIVAVPYYLENDNELRTRIVDVGEHSTNVIISCVDNIATRKMIRNTINNLETASYYSSGYPIIWIDSGNEEWSGQVVAGIYTNRVRSGGVDFKVINKKVLTIHTPDVFDYYPSMLTKEDKFNSELSCAERAISNPQNIATNKVAATIIFQMVNNILSGSINYGRVVFNSLFGNTRTTYITESLLKDHEFEESLVLYNRNKDFNMPASTDAGYGNIFAAYRSDQAQGLLLARRYVFGGYSPNMPAPNAYDGITKYSDNIVTKLPPGFASAPSVEEKNPLAETIRESVGSFIAEINR